MRLLFELGLEELPSRYVHKSEIDLAKNLQKLLEENRVEVKSVTTYSGPRRVALMMEMSDMQKDLNEVKLGPAFSVAIKDGKPTKALIGFLNSNDLKEDEYEIVDTQRGKYVQVKKFLKGEETIKILPKLLYEAIRKLEFEKTMKWSDNQFRFVRPIKWILALVDGKVLDFTFENVKASNITRGMRVFGSQHIELNNIDDYEKVLLENYVIANREKRQKEILDSIKKNCEDANEYVEIDKELLEEVTDIVEYPYAIKGEFNIDYLILPEELITITMKTHQRYFPVRYMDGRLSNHFVVVRNAPEYSDFVKKGNEKVIEPRLADSKFFFDEDLKNKLELNVEKLKNITFQKDMGTIYDKVERSMKIAKFLGANEDTLRAIYLAKADLVSNVINEKEFTGLQGMMGSIYAKASGENDVVSRAIEEHYRPRFQGDELPLSMEGAIAAISDKIDTGMGAFCVGLKPTGSKDPYAIRRAIQGVVYIALDKKLDLSYKALCEKAYEIFSSDKKVLYANALEDFENFMKQRLETVLCEKYPKELVSYVINIEDNFKVITEKLEKLKTLTGTKNFDDLINLLKRMKNIVKGSSSIEVNTSLFEDKYEENMYKLANELKGKDFSSSIDILLSNEEVINSFFDNVKINTEDEKLTNNRMALLNSILSTVGEIIEI